MHSTHAHTLLTRMKIETSRDLQLARAFDKRKRENNSVHRTWFRHYVQPTPFPSHLLQATLTLSGWSLRSSIAKGQRCAQWTSTPRTWRWLRNSKKGGDRNQNIRDVNKSDLGSVMLLWIQKGKIKQAYIKPLAIGHTAASAGAVFRDSSRRNMNVNIGCEDTTAEGVSSSVLRMCVCRLRTKSSSKWCNENYTFIQQ
jgi:hypothetical protein